MSKPKFPKRIFVAHDPNNAADEPQFLADTTEANLIEADGPTCVGRYELKEVSTLAKTVLVVK